MSQTMNQRDWDELRRLSNSFAMYDENGVDLSLIDENLRLTPTQRIIKHDRALAMVRALQEAGRKARDHAQHQTPAPAE